jgi:hypothetical protein
MIVDVHGSVIEAGVDETSKEVSSAHSASFIRRTNRCVIFLDDEVKLIGAAQFFHRSIFANHFCQFIARVGKISHSGAGLAALFYLRDGIALGRQSLLEFGDYGIRLSENGCVGCIFGAVEEIEKPFA